MTEKKRLRLGEGVECCFDFGIDFLFDRDGGHAEGVLDGEG